MKFIDKIIAQKDKLLGLVNILGPIFVPIKALAIKIIENPIVYGISFAIFIVLVLLLAS